VKTKRKHDNNRGKTGSEGGEYAKTPLKKQRRHCMFPLAPNKTEKTHENI
jgi:hypothetical protein